jgi:hypothetical protein
MTQIFSLGYYIFQSKYICSTLNTKLETFSAALHDFIAAIDVESDQDEFETETLDIDTDAEKLIGPLYS